MLDDKKIFSAIKQMKKYADEVSPEDVDKRIIRAVEKAFANTRPDHAGSPWDEEPVKPDYNSEDELI